MCVGGVLLEELSGFLMSCWLQIIIAVLASYLISSVNTSIIVTRIVMKKDIRTMGSGNAGFTNVLRCVGKVPAVITFVGDFLKGVISCLIAYLLMIGVQGDNAELYKAYLVYLAGVFAVLGHSFPLYYRFKGGKSVVTSFAVMLMTDWRTLICTLIIFAILFLLTRIISFCAVIDFSLFALNTFLWKMLDYQGVTSSFSPVSNTSLPFVIYATVMSFLIGIFVVVRHKENIKRLLNGTEKKIKAKSKNETEAQEKTE